MIRRGDYLPDLPKSVEYTANIFISTEKRESKQDLILVLRMQRSNVLSSKISNTNRGWHRLHLLSRGEAFM